MARSTIVILSLTALVIVNAESPWPNTDFGMETTAKAFEHVCWYESLKLLHPGTKGKTRFLDCTRQVDHLNGQLIAQSRNPDWTDDFLKTNFGAQMKNKMKYLTPEFKAACEKYLDDANMSPASDESEVLQDSGKEYPFKGFANCLIQNLRTKYGQQAVDAVVAEKVKGKKDFRTVMLERDNEYRAIHGVPPFKIDAQLNKDAQAWADNLAKRCYSGSDPHSKQDTRKFEGDHQGENVARGGASKGAPLPEDMGLDSSNGWYGEVDYYDYKTHDSVEPGNTEKQVGHFTATVWKGSKRAGYGYAYNPKCGTYKYFVVGRYFPGGNRHFILPDGTKQKQHPENVLPPKH